MLNMRRLTTLLSLLLVALFSIWLLLHNAHQSALNNANVPDSFMTNVNAVKLNQNGSPHYTLTTPKVENFQTHNTTKMDHPFMVLYKPGEPPWQIKADHGQGIDGQNQVILQGNVVIHQLPGPNSHNATLKTTKITGYPPRSYAETDQPVEITQPGTVVNAIGMQADLVKHTIKLLSNTHVIHGTPPKGDWSTIDSDSAEMNYKTRIATFNGNVRANDKNSTLTADKAIAHRNKNRQISRVIAYGNLAHYRTITSPKKPPLHAQAKIIKYYPPKHEVVLLDHAFARQGADTIRSPVIHYNTLKRVLHSTASKKGPTHIMIDNSGNTHIQN